MASPFYQVFTIDDVDLTYLIDSFDFEESVEEDNMLILQLSHSSIDLFDREDLQKGKELKFHFGYVGGKISPKRIVEVSSMSYAYESVSKLTLHCKDKGWLLKNASSSKVWTQVKISDVVGEIAKTFSFNSIVDPTLKEFEALPQGNKSYFDFLTYLAGIAINDAEVPYRFLPYRFFVQDQTIHFTTRDMSQDPALTITRGSDEFVKFRISTKKLEDSTSSSVKASGIDPESGEVITSDSRDLPEETSTGKFKVSYDVDGNETRKEYEAGKSTFIASTNKEALDAQVSKAQKEAALDEELGDLVIVGDPHVSCDTLISLVGFARVHQGNWYVKRVRHRIDQGGYLTTAGISRNGKAKGEEEVGGEVNNGLGPESSDSSKEQIVHVFDTSGVEQ